MAGQDFDAPAPPPEIETIETKVYPLNYVGTDQGWANVDNIITRFEQERKHVVESLQDNPKSLVSKLWCANGLLSYEKQCRCQMMSNIKYGLETEWACIGCRALSRLTDTNSKVKTFTIQAGMYINTVFDIFTYLVGKPTIEIGHGPNERARQLLRNNQLYQPCCPGLTAAASNENTIYCEADGFTNFVLAAMLWEELGYKYSFPVPHVLAAFICNESGYLILEKNLSYSQLQFKTSDNTSADNAALSYSMVRATLCQIILQFHLLRQHEVTLGNPSLARLQIRPESISYVVQDVTWTFPFMLYIVPSDVTCLQVKQNHPNLTGRMSDNNRKIRLFPKSPDNICGLKRLELSPKFNVHTRNINCDVNGESCTPVTTITYQITNETALTFEYLRYAGLPLFSNSIDIYLLFIALMCHKPFHDAIHEHPKLYELWECLWFPEDLITVNAKVKQYFNTIPTTVQLIEIIRGRECKCALLEELWERIASLKEN